MVNMAIRIKNIWAASNSTVPKDHHHINMALHNFRIIKTLTLLTGQAETCSKCWEKMTVLSKMESIDLLLQEEERNKINLALITQ